MSGDCSDESPVREEWQDLDEDVHRRTFVELGLPENLRVADEPSKVLGTADAICCQA